MIQMLSGEWIHLPVRNDIWRMYRNKRIREELDKVDASDLKAVREKKSELAQFFNCSFQRVSTIYAQEKERWPSTFEDASAVANRIYEEEFAIFQKEMESLLGCENKDTVTRTPLSDAD